MPKGYKNIFNHDFFAQDTEESFYWAGFIAADGCIRIYNSKYSEMYELQINLSNDDHEQLEKFKKSLNGNFNICVQKTKKNKLGEDLFISRIKLTSKKMVNDLARFDIGPRKSHTLTFPSWVKTHPLAKHFLRGYFDGDGGFYINTKRKNPQMSLRICGTTEFLTDYKEILELEIGFESVSKPYMYNGQGALNYGGNIQIDKIGKYLYSNANIYMDRKYDQAMNVEVRKKGRPTPEQIAESYIKYWSTAEVGKDLNWSQTGIGLLIHEYNLQYLYEEKIKAGIKVSGRSGRILKGNNG